MLVAPVDSKREGKSWTWCLGEADISYGKSVAQPISPGEDEEVEREGKEKQKAQKGEDSEH